MALECMHVYDKRVLPLLCAAGSGAQAEHELRALFAAYYTRTVIHNAAAPPSPWGLWSAAVGQQPMVAGAGQAIAELERVAADMELACAKKYCKGILSDDDGPRAVGALYALGAKHLDRQGLYTGDLVRLLPCRAGTEVEPCAAVPPIEVLRALYAANESYEAVRDTMDRRYVFDVNSSALLQLHDNSAAIDDNSFQPLQTHTQVLPCVLLMVYFWISRD